MGCLLTATNTNSKLNDELFVRLSCNGLKAIFCGADKYFHLNLYTNLKLDPTLGAWGVPLAALSVPSSRCRSPMLSHSHSDGEFPVKQGEENNPFFEFQSSYKLLCSCRANV